MEQRRVEVRLAERSYPVLIGAGLLADAGREMAALDGCSSLVVVTNPTVRALYGDALLEALESGATASLRKTVVEIPDGERHKHLGTVETIYDAVLGGGADRNTVLVALGGGVVGDITGFAAATILRGIRLAMVPTTLLAQVDSSVGGKTGVNRPQGKNLVGAFHQPSLVLADTATLASLAPREYRAGLAEVVKYGMIMDADLFALLEREAAALAARDPETLVEVVARCVRLKADVVENDEREGGLRRILNFGHTIGHAVEQVTAYDRYLHGEAVAMGMGAAARLSRKLGICDDASVARLEALLARLELEAAVPAALDPEALARAVSFDKKVEKERVAFIVSEGVGRCRQHKLTPAEILAFLKEEEEARR